MGAPECSTDNEEVQARPRPPRHRPAHLFPRPKAAPVEAAYYTTLQEATDAPEIADKTATRIAVNHAGQPPPNQRFIYKGELVEMIGVTFPTIWKWMQNPDNDFPQPIEIGGRVAWFESEILQWMATRTRRQYGKAGGVK